MLSRRDIHRLLCCTEEFCCPGHLGKLQDTGPCPAVQRALCVCVELGLGCSVWALLTRRARQFSWTLSCAWSQLPGLSPLDASSTFPGCDPKNGSRHCQMSPGGQSHPHGEPLEQPERFRTERDHGIDLVQPHQFTGVGTGAETQEKEGTCSVPRDECWCWQQVSRVPHSCVPTTVLSPGLQRYVTPSPFPGTAVTIADTH